MKITDLYRVKQGIDRCSSLVNVADINFAYTLAKIEAEIVAELRLVEKSRKEVPEEYKEYMTEREQLDIEYAVRQNDGTFQTLNDRLLICNPKEHAFKIAELQKKYKDIIALVKKNSEEFEVFLLQDCKAVIPTLPKGSIPAQVNVEQMKLLFPVID